MKQAVKKERSEANNVESGKEVFTLLLDMNNLMKISSVDKRTSESGVEYGLVYRTLTTIGKILAKKDFNHCVACYDGVGSGVLRYNIYSEYKANRGKNYNNIVNRTEADKLFDELHSAIGLDSRIHSMKLTDEDKFMMSKLVIQNILEELCVRQYEFDNVEGDDIISYYVHNMQPNEKAVIVSTDMDLTQLISENVIIYNPSKGEFINRHNSSEKLGILHENVVLAKILCGDSSDNINGIKGLGQGTLLKYFPFLRDKKSTLQEVIDVSRKVLEERKASKKSPLKVLGNIIDGITDGVQGKDIYKINEAIIDLSKPLLTDEAKMEMDESMGSPIDTTDRSVSNVCEILRKEGMDPMLEEETFGYIFSNYTRIMEMERRFFNESC